MVIKFSLYIVGNFLKFLGILMLAPGICSLIYKEDDVYIFVFSGIITSVTGFVVELLTKPSKDINEIDRKAGFLIASLCWITAGIFGALPYMLLGVFNNPVDAFFESVAGFTTTGASVMTNPEIYSYGILFWRNFTQWLGGMGIIVLAIAILPRLSVGGMQLMGLEAPGPTTEKLTPRIAETAKNLWAVYVVLSILLAILLYFGGMTVYDSIVHAFTTMSTGGFSSKAASIGHFDSVYIDTVITIFMFLAGVNFVLHFSLYRRKFSNILKNSELKFYSLVTLGFILLLTVKLWNVSYAGFFESLRFASFQVVSIITTTGFSSADFNLWPSFASFLLLMIMFLGGCAGSTSGSIKSVRIMVLIKKGYREIRKLIYPRGVFPIRVDDQAISEDIVSSISSFFLLYIFIAVTSTLILLVIEDISPISALSACAATIGNVGPGLEQVGPMENYSFFSNGAKLFLSVLMLVGRLELYAILVILTPVFWKK